MVGTYTMDLTSVTFISWNALSSLTSTSVLLSKMDAATTLQHNDSGGLVLKIRLTTGPQKAVSFIDTNLLDRLVTRIFNIPSGFFSIATTAGTYNAVTYLTGYPYPSVLKV